MAVPELAYVLVAADGWPASPAPAADTAGQQGSWPPPPQTTPSPPPAAARYTRSLLRQTLQLMGVKPRPSDKAANKVFLILQQRAALPPSEPLSVAARLHAAPGGHAGVTLSRPEFDRLVMDCLAAFDQQPPQAPPAAPQAASVPMAALPGEAGPAQQPPSAPLTASKAALAAAAAPTAGQQLQSAPVQPAAAVVPTPHQQPLAADAAARSATPLSTAAAAPVAPEQLHTAVVGTAGTAPAAGAGAVATAAAAAAAASAAAATTATSLPDFRIACSLREQRASVAVLLCGTSGTGKSTLAALLAARLGISTVVSTDSIRHMMRSFSSEGEDPLLWASTYQAGAHLQHQQQQQQYGSSSGGASGASGSGGGGGGGSPPFLDPRKAAIRGYKAQSMRVLEHVDRLLAGCEARRQSVVVEGVHLSLSMVVRLMQRHPSVVPFLVHISNEAKHMERFAVRSKVMTLRPEGNRYVKYFRNIRAIQDYLVKSADKHAIPKVNNTNVDRSVATIHTTLLGCLRRTAQGESMLSGASLSCKLLLEEYLRCRSATWSSSDMLQLIRRKSAVGRAPSPSEAATTVTLPASSPPAPLSEAAVDEQLRPVPVGARASMGGRRGEGAKGIGGQEDEGDNHSFYGSDTQSSSDAREGSTSCTCSSSSGGGEDGEGEEAEGSQEAGDEQAAAAAERRRSSSRGSSRGYRLAAGPAVAGGTQQPPDGSGGTLGTLGLPRRQRHRDRRRHHDWQGSSGGGGGSTVGEAAAGGVREFRRHRSDVGSVLEPEPQSDTEDAEVAASCDTPPALAVQAC